MKQSICITCSNTEYSGVFERVTCMKYATLHDYDIVKTFYIGEGSDSRVLDDIIEFCLKYENAENTNGYIQYILVSYENGFVSNFLDNKFLNSLEEKKIYLKII